MKYSQRYRSKNRHRIEMQLNFHSLFFAVSKHEKDNKSNHMTKRKRRENLCDTLQRFTKLNDSMTLASRLTDGPDNFRKNSSNYRL